ncbi:hypothetical protein BV20DRAFT_580493 [Pilatotrama ljubarskyi]|nr:hypothetical protein BV20DRAFT_580493 [Pilatotrama ljubarskyi]
MMVESVENAPTAPSPPGDDVKAPEHWNFQAPINRIPPELLVSIFQWVQWLYGWPHYSSFSRPRDWLQLTWVCRYWRSVALSTPILWASIVHCRQATSQEDWLYAFLERASGAMLDVRIDFWEYSEPTLRSIMVHANNIQRLALDLSPGSYSGATNLDELLHCFPSSMPALEWLELSVPSDWTSKPSSDASLSRQRLPNLQRLKLWGFNFPWESDLYTSLRSLALIHLRAPPAITELFHILLACPELEVLELERYDGDRDLEFPDDLHLRADAPVLSLPRLSKLQLYASLRTVSYICDRLLVPSTCYKDVRTTLPGSDTRQAEPISIIAKLPRQRVFLPQIVETSSVSLVVDDQALYVSFCGGLDAKAYISMSGIPPDDPEITPPVWKTVLDAFHAAPLTHFRLKYTSLHLISPKMWHQLFARFPVLDHIVAGPTFRTPGGPMHTYGPLLEALRDEKEEESGVLHAPRLRTLELDAITVDASVADALLSVLRKRSSKGLPLQQLVLRNSACDGAVDRDAFVADLQEYVKLRVSYSSCCCGHQDHDTLPYVLERRPQHLLPLDASDVVEVTAAEIEAALATLGAPN